MKKHLLSFTMTCLLLLILSCASRQQGQQTEQPAAALAGTWILDLVPTPQASFDSLYKNARPELTFDLAQKKFSGSTSCNRMNGALVCGRRSISFKGDIALTLMACPGEGETIFLANLKRINTYSVSADGKELTLIQGDLALMHFHKK